MFRSLSLTHFMKYEAASFEYGNGINVVRGASEAGKSTMLRGLLYALGGVRATGLAADDLVRWGSRPAQMKVEMTYENDGVTYTVKRAPSGAEVWFSGRTEPDVTGQTEVTEFCMRLISTDIDGLKNLMFASQNSMRGALESGPAATIALIEQLAELGQVDSLIQLVGEKLPAGSTAGVEGRIATLEGQAADLQAKTYDTAAAEQKKAEAAAAAEKAAEALPALQAEATKASERLATLQALSGAYQVHQHSVVKAGQDVERQRQNLAEAELLAATKPSADLENLRARLVAAEAHGKRLQAHREVASYLVLPEQFWEGSEASLRAEMSSLRESDSKDAEALADYDKRVAVAKSRMVLSSKCTYCGKDVSELDEVKRVNQECLEELDVCGKAAADLVTRRAASKATLKTLDALLAQNAARLRLSAAHSAFVEAHDITVPVTLCWVGALPGEQTEDLDALRKQVKTVEAEAARTSQASARLPDLQRAVAEAEERLAALQSQDLEVVSATEVSDAQSAKETAQAAAAQGLQNLEALRQKVAAAELQVQRIRAEAAADKAQIALIRQQVEAAEAEKAEIAENNQLIKDLRRVRPIVAERVWNMVLAAVSTYFTEMRGEDSVVTREGKEFLVNGKSVAGLSGSTKDILGLAIRMALTKTFLPQARFLVLDEPWAACDINRSERCLGFLQGAGFDQVLLVTHESSSESVADSLIQL